MKEISLNKIGSNVKVRLDQVNDRIPLYLYQTLSEDPYGTIIDYKMTDGQGIGVVLRLSDGTINWFFNQEIESNLSNQNKDYNKRKASRLKFSPSKRSRESLYFFLNPINFIKWLVYSTKDVI